MDNQEIYSEFERSGWSLYRYLEGTSEGDIGLTMLSLRGRVRSMLDGGSFDGVFDVNVIDFIKDFFGFKQEVPEYHLEALVDLVTRYAKAYRAIFLERYDSPMLVSAFNQAIDAMVDCFEDGESERERYVDVLEQARAFLHSDMHNTRLVIGINSPEKASSTLLGFFHQLGFFGQIDGESDFSAIEEALRSYAHVYFLAHSMPVDQSLADA